MTAATGLETPNPESDAGLAAALFAVDPAGTAGVWIRARPGPARDAWLARLRFLLPPERPIRRLPLNAPDDRLLGGLDLAATLRAGKPIAQTGILAEADGGVVLLAMAERLTAATTTRLTGALDRGEVFLERDGIARRSPARLGMVALDEGFADDERPPAALLDRLAFQLELPDAAWPETPTRDGATIQAATIQAARDLLADVVVDEIIVAALCATALSLGIVSIRAAVLAVRVARAACALAGRQTVTLEDAAVAGRLVFARRATRMPASEADAGADQPEQAPEPPPETDPLEDAASEEDTEQNAEIPLADILLAAIQAAIPADLLSQLRLTDKPASGRSAGRAGTWKASRHHGRPIGTRRGDPKSGARLHVIETLKAAAPWQKLRRASRDPAAPPRLEIRRDDFRITVFKQRTGTTTVFVVDASGSAALARLAETKGAVELLLADCYVRRDQVALIAFRGRGAELLLPPTQSLVRAKRSLATLPGGGATPLALGIDAAVALAETIARAGQTPILTLLTDGRANIARDGAGGRARAEADALSAAAAVRAARLTALLVDTSPRPNPAAQRLAGEMGARYLALPYADAAALSQAVRATIQ